MDLFMKGLKMANIIKIAAVVDKTELSKSTIYAMIKRKEFPAQLCLHRRAVGWLEDEIDEWIVERITEKVERQFH